MTRRTGNLELMSADWLEVHPDDAAALGLARRRDGDGAQPRAARSSCAARMTERIEPGHVFTAFHFPEVRTNLLIGQSADVNTSCPEYKVVAVAVEPRRRSRAPRRRPLRAEPTGRRRLAVDAPRRLDVEGGGARRRRGRGRRRAAARDPPERRAGRGHDAHARATTSSWRPASSSAKASSNAPPEVTLAEDLAANIVEVLAPGAEPAAQPALLHHLVLRHLRQGRPGGGGGDRSAGGGGAVDRARAARRAARPPAPARVRAHRRPARHGSVRRRGASCCSCARTWAATTPWTR